MNAEIPLADFINELRGELLEAMKRGAGSNVRFTVEKATVELQVVATREKQGNGKLSFKVFGAGIEAGGGLTSSGASTQKLVLSLLPVDSKGNPIAVVDAGATDRDF
jgi:hypothetical protein